MKKILLSLAVLSVFSVLSAAETVLIVQAENETETNTESRVCSKDLRVCPDGTKVGRTGENCEFKCPRPLNSASSTQGIRILGGQVGTMMGGEGIYPKTGDEKLDAKIKALIDERDRKLKAAHDEFLKKMRNLLGDKKILIPMDERPGERKGMERGIKNGVPFLDRTTTTSSTTKARLPLFRSSQNPDAFKSFASQLLTKLGILKNEAQATVEVEE